MSAAATARWEHAAALANAVRSDRARLRRALAGGEIGLHQVLADPPQCVEHLLVYELIRMAPQIGRGTIEQLGRAALKANVNLAVSCERMSERTRRWLLENVPVRGPRCSATLSSPRPAR